MHKLNLLFWYATTELIVSKNLICIRSMAVSCQAARQIRLFHSPPFTCKLISFKIIYSKFHLWLMMCDVCLGVGAYHSYYACKPTCERKLKRWTEHFQITAKHIVNFREIKSVSLVFWRTVHIFQLICGCEWIVRYTYAAQHHFPHSKCIAGTQTNLSDIILVIKCLRT